MGPVSGTTLQFCVAGGNLGGACEWCWECWAPVWPAAWAAWGHHGRSQPLPQPGLARAIPTHRDTHTLGSFAINAAPPTMQLCLPRLPQLLEWWYTSAEQRLGGSKALPPPPPPPAPLPAPGGVPLPADITRCPLCRHPRTNPAMVAVSGYVFCYPCAHRFVAEQGCCPVTRLPCSVEHIRRLYQGM